MFAKPGLIVAASNFLYPAKIRALGAKTVYMDINFHRRIGTPTAPIGTVAAIDRANKLYDYAAASMRCAHPYIALNELFGAATATPWSPNNAQYRSDVLTYMKTLAARGARPLLMLSARPYTGGDAADWWRQAAQYGDIIREDYFGAPFIYKQGAVAANRYLRQSFRRAAEDLLAIGIPAKKIGLMVGFQTTPGQGGRENLQPATAWYDTVKWQALSARQVARELGLGSIWSWGWEAYSDAERDPAKQGAACVWLWVRSPKFCNGPRAAGAGFDASLTEGQITLPQGVQCVLDRRRMSSFAINDIARVTGDRELAFSTLFQRLVTSGSVQVSGRDLAAAERAVVSSRFGGNGAGYRAALGQAHASQSVAAGVLADELRRARIEARLRVSYPSASDVTDYFQTYGAAQARAVQAKPAPWWLNGRKQGIALASSAPFAVMKIPAGKWTPVWTTGGIVRVRPLARPRTLASVGLGPARQAIVASLRQLARDQAFDAWSLRVQRSSERRVVCLRDDFPQLEAADLTEYLPFLELR